MKQSYGIVTYHLDSLGFPGCAGIWSQLYHNAAQWTDCCKSRPQSGSRERSDRTNCKAAGMVCSGRVWILSWKNCCCLPHRAAPLRTLSSLPLQISSSLPRRRVESLQTSSSFQLLLLHLEKGGPLQIPCVFLLNRRAVPLENQSWRQGGSLVYTRGIIIVRRFMLQAAKEIHKTCTFGSNVVGLQAGQRPLWSGLWRSTIGVWIERRCRLECLPRRGFCRSQTVLYRDTYSKESSHSCMVIHITYHFSLQSVQVFDVLLTSTKSFYQVFLRPLDIVFIEALIPFHFL